MLSRLRPIARIKPAFPSRFTHYAVLGIPPTAPLPDIKLAFREKAKQHHPDLVARGEGSETVLAAFRAVNEAYAVLSDADKRAAYDAALAAGAAGAAGGEGQPLHAAPPAAPRAPPKPVPLRLRNEGVLGGLPPPLVPNSVWQSAAGLRSAGGGGSGGGAAGAGAGAEDAAAAAAAMHRGPAEGSGGEAAAVAFRTAMARGMEREGAARARVGQLARSRRERAAFVGGGGGGGVLFGVTAVGLATAAALWVGVV